MQTIENKKGNKGFIIGYWNTSTFETDGISDNKVKVYIAEVEVMSCGKKQMTLMEKVHNTMSKTFHNPDKPIYVTLADATEAAQVLVDEWYERSIERAPKSLESFRNAYSHFDWWPENEAKRLAFIEDLKNRAFPLEIVNKYA